MTSAPARGDESELAGLRRRLATSAPDGEALIAAARPLLDRPDWVGRLLAREAEALGADPFHRPPFRALPHGRQIGLVLWDEGGLRLTLARVPLEAMAAHKARAAARRSISFTGLLTDSRVMAGEGVLHWWAAPPAGPGFTAAGTGRARPVGRSRLRPGVRFLTDGRHRAWTMAPAAGGDLVLLQASAPAGDAPLAIEYDAEDGRFLSASATDGAVTRLQLMATVLRQMGRVEAAPAIAAAAAALPFYGRWHLLRELALLDRAAAMPALRAAADDPHPELSAAATMALARMAA